MNFNSYHEDWVDLSGQECLLCNVEYLSSNSQNPRKKLPMAVLGCNPRTGGAGDRSILEKCWPPTSYRSSERPYFKGIKERLIEQDSDVLL